MSMKFIYCLLFMAAAVLAVSGQETAPADVAAANNTSVNLTENATSNATVNITVPVEQAASTININENAASTENATSAESVIAAESVIDA